VLSFDHRLTRSERRSHEAAGLLGIAGGVLRLIAYALPWIDIHAGAAVSGVHLQSSGNLAVDVFGSWFVGASYSIVVIIAGGICMSDNEHGAMLLRALGFGALLLSGLELAYTLLGLEQLNSLFAAFPQGSLSIGPWVVGLGSIIALIAGVKAMRIETRTPRASGSRRVPPRPDLPERVEG
jgi:hypothetical protein